MIRGVDNLISSPPLKKALKPERQGSDMLTFTSSPTSMKTVDVVDRSARAREFLRSKLRQQRLAESMNSLCSSEASDRWSLSSEEGSQWATLCFSAQSESGSLSIRHLLDDLNAAECNGRQAIDDEYGHFAQFALQNEPIWREQAAAATKERMAHERWLEADRLERERVRKGSEQLFERARLEKQTMMEDDADWRMVAEIQLSEIKEEMARERARRELAADKEREQARRNSQPTQASVPSPTTTPPQGFQRAPPLYGSGSQPGSSGSAFAPRPAATAYGMPTPTQGGIVSSGGRQPAPLYASGGAANPYASNAYRPPAGGNTYSPPHTTQAGGPYVSNAAGLKPGTYGGGAGPQGHGYPGGYYQSGV